LCSRRDIKKRLNAAHEDFQCPETLEKSKQKEETKEDSKVKSASELGLEFSWLEPLKQRLKDNPKAMAKLALQFLKGKGFVSDEFLPVVTLVINTVADNPDYVTYVVSFFDTCENFFRSEGGQRIFKILPQVVQH
jgi:hypothetical protein